MWKKRGFSCARSPPKRRGRVGTGDNPGSLDQSRLMSNSRESLIAATDHDSSLLCLRALLVASLTFPQLDVASAASAIGGSSSLCFGWTKIYPMTNFWGLPTSFHTWVSAKIQPSIRFLGEKRYRVRDQDRFCLVHQGNVGSLLSVFNRVVFVFVEPGHRDNLPALKRRSPASIFAGITRNVVPTTGSVAAVPTKPPDPKPRL
ncbi:hypothetical protein BDM02DRAFT_1851216 [Thelephora ganbajun]|uniref:Uncharacterized protein n=1 Tax=Thelephora ganbajun TaxID=370292 RepID=A0ACB6ZIM4_THEGA|nr:hypothetical protein BDM02DRAFT_1851216 [Thelephora ganbajun]